MDETTYLSAREMAELLGVSRTTAIRYASDPASGIRSIRDGRLRRYDRSDVEAFAAERLKGSTGLTTADEHDETPLDSAQDDRIATAAPLGEPDVLHSPEGSGPAGSPEDASGDIAEPLGGPRSLEDEAVLGEPDVLDAPDRLHMSATAAPDAARDDVALPTLEETLASEAVGSPELVLDDEIVASLDLMAADDASELLLDDALDGIDDASLMEAALLDEGTSFIAAEDLVALVREQQEQLITAQRRIGELEALLSTRLDPEQERALRDEVASYKTLVDNKGKASKNDKKDKKEKKKKG